MAQGFASVKKIITNVRYIMLTIGWTYNNNDMTLSNRGVKMKILVCIKPVEDPEKRAGGSDFYSKDTRMNRFDEYALEEALQIREAMGKSTVDVLSLGPNDVDQLLKRAMGMGADRGIHLLAEENPFPDPYSTAFLMAEYARDKGYDLILTGVMSEDLMQAQVGPMIGEMLSMDCATAVIATRISSDFKTVSVEREIEGGAREGWELTLPALLTIQSGINRPRYPILSQMLRASRQKLEVIKGESIGSPLARQVVTHTAIPEKQRQGLTLHGSSREKAEALMTIFREKGFLKDARNQSPGCL